MAITKTSFMRGMQCPKMLWLDKHKPSLKVIPEEVQKRLDEGNEFGDKAMGMFGPYEEMTIYLKGTMIPDKKAMVEKTKVHLKRKTPVIAEASFMDYNNFCAIDILRLKNDAYDMYEVKNASQVHEQFIKDAAFQYYIARRCRLNIDKIYIVIHGEDEDDPFVPVEVSDEVKDLYDWVNENIWRLNRLQKEKEELAIEAVEQCDKPYECWYYGYCHADIQTDLFYQSESQSEPPESQSEPESQS